MPVASVSLLMSYDNELHEARTRSSERGRGVRDSPAGAATSAMKHSLQNVCTLYTLVSSRVVTCRALECSVFFL